MSITAPYRDAASAIEASWREQWDATFSYARAPLSDEQWRWQWEAGLWRIALYEAGDVYPEETITLELLREFPVNELSALLWEYLCIYIDRAGQTGVPELELIKSLPRGLRISYTLTLLDSEISNGGLQQFFTNSSGALAGEALDDLETIGATDAYLVLKEAVRLNNGLEARHEIYRRRWTDQECPPSSAETAAFWSDYEAHVEPEFDRLSSAWCALEDSPELPSDPHERYSLRFSQAYDVEKTLSPWKHFRRYVEAHPEEFVHSPGAIE